MFLEGSKVVCLVALSVVGGGEVGLGSTANESTIGPGPRVTAAQAGNEGLDGGVLSHSEYLVGELPHPGAEVLDESVAQAGIGFHQCLKHGRHHRYDVG